MFELNKRMMRGATFSSSHAARQPRRLALIFRDIHFSNHDEKLYIVDVLDFHISTPAFAYEPSHTMTLATTPKATLHALPEADGSATYTTPSGFSIFASFNGPIEAQRRDELPEEAFLEVIVLPESGSGSMLDLLHNAFKQTS